MKEETQGANICTALITLTNSRYGFLFKLFMRAGCNILAAKYDTFSKVLNANSKIRGAVFIIQQVMPNHKAFTFTQNEKNKIQMSYFQFFLNNLGIWMCFNRVCTIILSKPGPCQEM